MQQRLKSFNAILTPSVSPLNFRVYIENTDTFGVAFYANYPVWFERSISVTKGSVRLQTFKLLKLRSAGINPIWQK